jgi:hypothetical protein
MPAVSCPSCHQKLRVPDHLAGRRLTCPQCNEVLVVPVELLESDEETPAPEDAAPEEEPLPTSARIGIVSLALACVSARCGGRLPCPERGRPAAGPVGTAPRPHGWQPDSQPHSDREGRDSGRLRHACPALSTGRRRCVLAGPGPGPAALPLALIAAPMRRINAVC